MLLDPTVQILRHGDRVELRMLGPAEVAAAMRRADRDAGRRITPGALARRSRPCVATPADPASRAQLWRSEGRRSRSTPPSTPIRQGTGRRWSAVLERALGDLERGESGVPGRHVGGRRPARLGEVADRLGIGSRRCGPLAVPPAERRDIHDRRGRPPRVHDAVPRDHLRSFGPRLSTFTGRQRVPGPRSCPRPGSTCDRPVPTATDVCDDGQDGRGPIRFGPCSAKPRPCSSGGTRPSRSGGMA